VRGECVLFVSISPVPARRHQSSKVSAPMPRIGSPHMLFGRVSFFWPHPSPQLQLRGLTCCTVSNLRYLVSPTLTARTPLYVVLHCFCVPYPGPSPSPHHWSHDLGMLDLSIWPCSVTSPMYHARVCGLRHLQLEIGNMLAI